MKLLFKFFNFLIFVHPLAHCAPVMKIFPYFQAMSPEFAEYQKQVLKNAKTVAEELIKRGYKIVSGIIVLLLRLTKPIKL